MRSFTRLNPPQTIVDNWEEIGRQYAQKRHINPSYSFSWPQYNYQRLNQIALPTLLAQTDHHCSYCDKFPLHKGDESIDHFKPKTNPLYYLIVSQWENLYLACKHCQDSKKGNYNDFILRPDAPDFSFSRYFRYNYTNHTIEINPIATLEDQQKAMSTIEVFSFNYPAVKTSRRYAFERFFQIFPDLNDSNYRFMFE